MRFAWLLAAALGASLIAAPVLAQDFPTRPITLIVGFAPGGGLDVTARFAALHMSQLLGQPIVVENRPGANSSIATRMVARAQPDGYTLLLSAYVISTNIHGMKEPGYKLSDFVNVGGYGHTGYTLLMNTKTTGARTAQELIEFGRRNPGKLTYGSLGTASTPNFVAHSFNEVAKMDWREIPFKSASDAISSVVTGTIDVYFGGPSSVLGVMGQPNVVVAAVTGNGRSSVLPNVPTFAEVGVAFNDSYTIGIFAPSGTPRPIVDKLRQALEDAKKNPDNRKKIEEGGLQVYDRTWQDFDREMAADSVAFVATMKKLGIEPQ